jgi:hypothetical protein
VKSLVLQDWITIQGAPSQSSVGQSASAWLETGRYHDATFFVAVTELTVPVGGPTLTLAIETAPAAEERLFLPLTSLVLSSLGVGTFTRAIRADATYTPIARWVRWRVATTGVFATDWTLTFRVLVAANAPRIPLGA